MKKVGFWTSEETNTKSFTKTILHVFTFQVLRNSPVPLSHPQSRLNLISFTSSAAFCVRVCVYIYLCIHTHTHALDHTS